MRKERLFYLDFIRAIATISIIMTHFNARYIYAGAQYIYKAIISTTFFNIYIGDWGVSLFFTFQVCFNVCISRKVRI